MLIFLKEHVGGNGIKNLPFCSIQIRAQKLSRKLERILQFKNPKRFKISHAFDRFSESPLMASKDPEEPVNTETDEETVALRKKRSRRVSFADREITSVHIFNRDEDCETSSDSLAVKQSLADEENEVLGFFRDLAADSDDSKDVFPGEDYDEDDISPRKSFLRPLESPGSSNIGSAASNDEDDFFGPVSSSFIRPRRLSDSAASEDNHEITMDSTAFSMHFRSIVKSEPEDIQTPTGAHTAFEDKTPSQAATLSDPGSFMVLTKAKKPMSQTPPTAGKVFGSRDSNDMSLVGENPRSYDYGRLSPTLEAILATGSEDMQAIPIFEAAAGARPLKSEVSIFNDCGSGCMDVKDKRNVDMCNVGLDDVSQEGVSVVQLKLGEGNGGSTVNLMDQIIDDWLLKTNGDETAADNNVDYLIQTPNQLKKVNKGLIEVEPGSNMPNVEFPAVRCTPPAVNVNSNVNQLNLLSQQEAAGLHSTEELLKENSPIIGTGNSHVDQLPDQQLGSPSAGSISSLSAKRKQIFLDTNNSSGHSLYATPSLKQPGSFLGANIKLCESVSSLQKSISKFKIIESSPHASTLHNGPQKSECGLLENLSSAASHFNIVAEENRGDLRHQHVDVPIMNLEKHLLSADRNNGVDGSKVYMDGDGSGNSTNLVGLNQDEKTTALAKAGDSLDQLSNFISHEDKLTEMMTAMASSGKKEMNHLMMSQNEMEGKSGIPKPDSPSLEITFDQRKEQKSNDSNTNVSPPVNRLDQKLSLSVEYQGCLSSNLQQHAQYKEIVGNGSGVDRNPIEYAPSDCHLNGVADKTESLLIEQRVQSSPPLCEINHFKEHPKVKRADDRESYPSTLNNISEIIRNFPTPPRNINLPKFQSGSPDKSHQIINDKTQTKEEPPKEMVKASSHVPASSLVQKSLNEPSTLKSPNLQKPAWSPSRKELCNLSLKDSMHLLVGEDGLPSKSISDGQGNGDSGQGFDNPQSSILLQNFENSSGQKRKGEEIFGDAENDKIRNWIQRSPKVHKNGANELELNLEYSNGINKGNEKFGGDTKLKHWTDISHKFSTETDQVLPPEIDKLDIRAMGRLEDILLHLMKVNKYGMLCSEILSKKTYDQSSNIRHKRVAETRSLLHKIVYEKANLQIMRLKHERLLKRAQLLSSGLQKLHILKLNYVKHLSASGERDAQVDNKLLYSSFINFEGKNEVVTDKVTALRQEAEALDKKTKNLIKSFHTRYKMNGDLSYSDTIALLNDHLKKKTRCRYIREDLQLWQIDDLERTHSDPILVLNYNGFICQRFIINAGPVSSMAISNKVQDIKVTKIFPNMDAFTAFAFVFDAKSTKKFVGCKSLAQETQTTSSLLRNLVSVLEEVQLARIQIRNLTQTCFNSSSVEQLDLQLSFVDFNSGGKVIMTLDMTCLNRGVYPSEILPYHLVIPSAKMQNSPLESLSAQINAATSNLAVGYSRIFRLCQCVSQLVQFSSR